MSKSFPNTITTFFALAMLFPNIANLHSLGHLSEHDAATSCECCEIFTQYNQLDLVFGDSYYPENEIRNHSHAWVQLFSYNSPVEKIVTPVFIYNKPPPL